jgi:hypothetical protein
VEPIRISEEESRAICYGENDEYEEIVEETQNVYSDNGGRWLKVIKRVSDGATFAIQRESENETEGYGEELIPVESTTVLVSHRVWHRPGAFVFPKSVEDANALTSSLDGLL